MVLDIIVTELAYLGCTECSVSWTRCQASFCGGLVAKKEDGLGSSYLVAARAWPEIFVRKVELLNA